MRHLRVAAVCVVILAVGTIPAACVSNSTAPPPGVDAGLSFDSGLPPGDTGLADATAIDAARDATTPTDAADAASPIDGSPVDAADAAEASTLLNGLLAWYRAEGNANDFTGNYNGALFGQNDASVTFVAGRDGGEAFSLPGANAEVNIPNGIIPLSATSYTIAAWTWINPAALDAQQHQIAYQGSLQGEIFLTLDVNNLIDFSVHAANDGYPAAYSPQEDGGLATGTWVSVVGVRRETMVELWIGGTMVSSSGINEDAGLYVNDAGSSSSIGGQDESNYYWGYLDDVRFYGRALSATEIQSL